MQLFASSFAVVPDPRADNSRHDLIEILFIAFIAILCGCKTCVEIVEFAEAKKKFFAKILTLKHGVPSHDTFSSVFRILDPKALDDAFRKFMAAFGTALAERGIIAIDGKSLKGAFEKGKKHAPKMMVSAFAAEMRMTLATLEAKGRNEVDAALHDLLDDARELEGVVLDVRDALSQGLGDRLVQVERLVDAEIPVIEGQQIIAITDNLSTRGTQEVTEWLEAHPRWSFQFTPTHASWLNQIEIVFSILVRKLLKHGIFTSEQDLAEQMLAFVETYNQTAKPFAWTYTGKTLEA